MTRILSIILLIFPLLLGSVRAEDQKSNSDQDQQKTPAQTRAKERQKKYEDASKDIKRHFEPSYITFFGGYDAAGPMDFGDIFYEGQLTVHLNWYNPNERPPESLRNRLFLLYVPVRIQVRQFRSESSPVKTPSFNPGLRGYYLHESWINDTHDFSYVSLGFHHYSNGQIGPHYNPDATINTENGSFSSEYVEAAFYRNLRRAWWKLNYRQYIVSEHWSSWEPAQSHYFERALVEVSIRYEFTERKKKPAVRLTGGYKLGRDYVSPGRNASFEDNLQFTGEVFAPLQHWQDVQVYLRWDVGYDYYNINYQNRINRIQFGLVSTNF
jgi:hypothetical protein